VKRGFRMKAAATAGCAAVLAAGQVCALAFAGGRAAPADTSPPPPTTAPVTTVVAPTATLPAVTPDAPPATAPAPAPKPKAKPKAAPTAAPKVQTTAPKTTSAPKASPAPAARAPSPAPAPAVTPSASVPRTVVTPQPAHRTSAALAAARQAAARAAADRSKKRKAAALKALLATPKKPSYRLTPPGGGDHPRTPIRHFIYLLQENHTFDNYFGTYGHGSDGIPKGVCMPLNLAKPKAGCLKPFHLGGQPTTDLGHNPIIYRGQYDGGRMNGFANILRLQDLDPTEVMGYYDGTDIPYYWNLADRFVLFDRFFSSDGDGSGPNHMFAVAAYPGDPHDVPKGGFTQPTIFDRLQRAGVSWKFYVSNYDPRITYRSHVKGDRDSQVVWVPLLDMARFIDRKTLARHIVPLSQYYRDLADGTLPAVAYVAPSGASEHPPGSIQSGERFVRTLINNLTASRYWKSSAFMLAYDDWGGWYDHVKPPQVDAFGYGFRVPALLVSAYAHPGYVDHTTLDFTSPIKFIEENWGLAPLTQRDARANSVMGAFDFSKPPRPAEIIPATRSIEAATAANSSIIYPAYGLAAGVVLALMLVALLRSRAGRRTTPALGDFDS
jgi:phospholipase C